jgi:hypothetical protein
VVRVTGPRSELAETGRIGPALAGLLYRTVAVIGVSRRFPPPAGSTSWGDSAVAETAHQMIDGERGAKRLADALLRSTDEESFARQIEGATVNFLRDIARATDQGKLVLRVAEILRSGEEFAEQHGKPPRWGLADGSAAPSAAGPMELARAAAAERDVVVPAWTSDRRDAPVADRPSITRILIRVLRAADGTLTAAEAAEAVAARVDVRRSPLTVEVGVLERISEPAESADPATATAVMLEARQVFSALDDRERIIIAGFDEKWEVVADRLALKRSQVMLLRQRVVRRLQADLGIVLNDGGTPRGGDEVAVLTVAAVRDLCVAWAEGRT